MALRDLVSNVKSLFAPATSRASNPFSSYGGSGFPGGWNLFGLFPNTNIDYAQEVGELTQASIVMTCVNWLGTTLPEAPMVLHRRTKGSRKKETIYDHDLLHLLERPNKYYTGELLYRAFALSWLIDGNVYWLKVRNKIGEVIELWYVPHFQMEPYFPPDGSEFISFYVLWVDGVPYRVEKKDVIHFRYNIDPKNPRRGLSPLGSVLREIFIDSESANFAAALLKNFAIPGIIISPKEKGVAIDPKERERLREDFKRKFGGDGRFEPMVLSGATDVLPLSFDPKKMDLRSLTKIAETRIPAICQIPPIVLNLEVGIDKGTYSNYEQAREQAYEGCVIPTHRYVDGELSVQLLPDFDKDKSLRCGRDYSEVRVLSEDQDALFKRWGQAYNDGLAMRSEGRDALGLKVVPERDEHFVNEMSKPALLLDEDDDEELADPKPAPEPEPEEDA